MVALDIDGVRLWLMRLALRICLVVSSVKGPNRAAVLIDERCQVGLESLSPAIIVSMLLGELCSKLARKAFEAVQGTSTGPKNE